MGPIPSVSLHSSESLGHLKVYTRSELSFDNSISEALTKICSIQNCEASMKSATPQPCQYVAMKNLYTESLPIESRAYWLSLSVLCQVLQDQERLVVCGRWTSHKRMRPSANPSNHQACMKVLPMKAENNS